MSVVRTRSRQKTRLQGVDRVNGLDFVYSYTEREEVCQDSWKKTVRDDGTLPPTALTLRKTQVRPAMLSYQTGNMLGVGGSSKVVNFGSGIPMGISTGAGSPTGGWPALEGTDASLVAKLLADTNPFRYEVSIPIMISELVEASSLLKLATANMFSLTGSGYLNWAFGWKLMQADIRSLASITTAIESRIKEFNSLVTKGGLRRSVKLGGSTQQGTPSNSTTYSSAAGSCVSRVTPFYRTSVWGSTRWKPVRGKEIEVSQLASFNEALKIVLDLKTPDASTAWEAIPFSWLVDYFLNVGNVLQAIENSDLVEPYDICVMRRRQITYHYAPVRGIGLNNSVHNAGIPGNWVEGTATEGETVHDFKVRTIHSSSRKDLLSFGFMTKNQATNLIALLFSLARFKK